MTRYGLTFHHLGLAVRDREPAHRFLEGLGYEIGSVVHDPLQDVFLSLAHASGAPVVEVITAAGEGGKLANLLKERTELLYHICYETADAATAIAAIRSDGFRVLPVSSAQPALLFANIPVSFHYIRGFGLIEIVENHREIDA